MGHYSIEIGATDGFRHIGIEPPVDQNQKDQTFKELGQEIEREAIENGRALSVTKPYRRPAHSELTLTCTRYVERARRIAQRIGSILEEGGHTVVFNPDIKRISDGYYLFGGQAEHL